MQGGYGRGGGGRGLANGEAPEAAAQQPQQPQRRRQQQQDDPAWRAAGCPVAGPEGWTQYRTEDNEVYYHNSKTQETTWVGVCAGGQAGAYQLPHGGVQAGTAPGRLPLQPSVPPPVHGCGMWAAAHCSPQAFPCFGARS